MARAIVSALIVDASVLTRTVAVVCRALIDVGATGAVGPKSRPTFAGISARLVDAHVITATIVNLQIKRRKDIVIYVRRTIELSISKIFEGAYR